MTIAHKNLWYRKIKDSLHNFKNIFYESTENHKLEDVFKPLSVAISNYINRKRIEPKFNKILLMSGMQAIVCGPKGCGKTTFVHSLLNQRKIKFIATDCMENNTVDQLVTNAIEKLNPFYPVERTSIKGHEFSAEFKAQYKTMEASVKSAWKSEIHEKEERMQSPRNTVQWLAEMLGLEGIVWVIDDLHKVNVQERQKLVEIFSIFNNKSNLYSCAKVIVIGEAGSGRELIEGDLMSFISEVKVPPMTSDEVKNIVYNGERLLNIAFDTQVRELIFQLSIDNPAYCHKFCFNICYEHGITRTQNRIKEIKSDLINDIIIAYLLQNPDMYKEIFDQALNKINLN
jgi:Cdc6-like AAA superfamily ATPase